MLKKSKRLFIILIAALMVLLVPVTSYAKASYAPHTLVASSSWRPSDDGGIYKGNEENHNEVASTVKSFLDGVGNLLGDVLSSIFGGFLIAIGDSIYEISSLAGVEFDAIIYGRVGGSTGTYSDGTIKPSLFSFDLTTGNIYGIAAMFLYVIIRRVFLLIFVCVMLLKLCKYILTGGSARQRAEFKEQSIRWVILIAALFLMPKVLDLLLYIRDVILYTIMYQGGSFIESKADSLVNIPSVNSYRYGTEIIWKFFGASGEYSIIKLFRASADSSFMNAFMYLAACVLQWYFAAVYVGTALAMVVLVVVFPFACVMELFRKGSIGNIISQMAGIIMVPIIDAVLLFIPMLIGILGTGAKASGYTVIQLLVMLMIIPARGVIRQTLGLGSSSSMELAGLGALMGAMRLTKSLVGGVKSAVNSIKEGRESAKQDEDVAKTNEAILDAKNEEQKQVRESAIEDINAQVGDDLKGGPIDSNKLESSMNDSNLTRSEKMAMRNADLSNRVSALKASRLSQSEANADAENHISMLDDKIAANNAQISRLRLQNQSLNKSVDSEQIAQNLNSIEAFSKENDLLGREKLEYRDLVSKGKQKLSRIDAAISAGNSALVSSRAIGGSTPVSEMAALDRQATIDNFEMPEFRNMSLERKNELYKERASMQRRQAILNPAMGAVGGIAGGVLGASAGGFLGVAPMSYMAAGGMDLGGEIFSNISGMSTHAAAGRRVVRGNTFKNVENVTVQGENETEVQITRENTNRVTYSDVSNEIVADVVDKQLDMNERMPGLNTTGSWQSRYRQIASDPAKQVRLKEIANNALLRGVGDVSSLRSNLMADNTMTYAQKNEMLIKTALDNATNYYAQDVVNDSMLFPSMQINGKYIGKDSPSWDSSQFSDYIKKIMTRRNEHTIERKLRSMGWLFE